MASVTIGSSRQFVDGGRPALSATINVDGRSFDVYVKASHGPLADGSEPFVAAALLPAMKIGAILQVEGALSPRLLANLPTIQDILLRWHTDLTRIPVQAQGVPARWNGNGRGSRDECQGSARCLCRMEQRERFAFGLSSSVW